MFGQKKKGIPKKYVLLIVIVLIIVLFVIFSVSLKKERELKYEKQKYQ